MTTEALAALFEREAGYAEVEWPDDDWASVLRFAAVRLRALDGVLRMVEWRGDGDPASEDWCPWCGCERADGHAADCPRQAALAEDA